MNLEFNIYELSEEFGINEFKADNEFIKVGERLDHEIPHYLMQAIVKGNLTVIDGLNLHESAYQVPINIAKLKGDGNYYDSYTFDIPNKYLNKDIVEEIKRINQ